MAAFTGFKSEQKNEIHRGRTKPVIGGKFGFPGKGMVLENRTW